MKAGTRPANGAPSTGNRRRSHRAHERLDDSAQWRYWLADRPPRSGWIPGGDGDDDDE